MKRNPLASSGGIDDDDEAVGEVGRSPQHVHDAERDPRQGAAVLIDPSRSTTLPYATVSRRGPGAGPRAVPGMHEPWPLADRAPRRRRGRRRAGPHPVRHLAGRLRRPRPGRGARAAHHARRPARPGARPSAPAVGTTCSSPPRATWTVGFCARRVLRRGERDGDRRGEHPARRAALGPARPRRPAAGRGRRGAARARRRGGAGRGCPRPTRCRGLLRARRLGGGRGGARPGHRRGTLREVRVSGPLDLRLR